MSRDPKLRFADIIEGCSAIDVYILGYSFDDFQRDPKTRDAVVRQMEIIGEAVKSIPTLCGKNRARSLGETSQGFAICSFIPTLALTIRWFGMRLSRIFPSYVKPASCSSLNWNHDVRWVGRFPIADIRHPQFSKTQNLLR